MRGATPYGSLVILAICTGVFELASLGASSGQTISHGTAVTVETKFTAPASDHDGKPRGISGMACLGKDEDPVRECLVVNDEEAFGEIAILTRQSLKPTGKVLSFVAKGESGKGIVGAERVAPCESRGKFAELDGEGVAFSADYVYVIGSHSCSGAGKYKPSSYLISRFRPASRTAFLMETSMVIERTWRGGDMLFLSDAGSKYGAPKTAGTNIEGIAVVGDHLYAGLRTPTGESSAYLVRAPTGALFAPGKEPLPRELVETRTLTLGKNAGIRDLASLADGSLLILSGPSIEQADIEYMIWHLPTPIWTSEPIARLVVRSNAKGSNEQVPKAEALALLQEVGQKAVVLVSYDNVDEGAPAKHEVPLGP